MKQTTILVASAILGFVGCGRMASPTVPADPAPSMLIPANPPSQWYLTVRADATTGAPGDFHRLIMAYTSGVVPGRISVHLPQQEARSHVTKPFKKELNQTEIDQFYHLVASAIRGHTVGQKPEVVVKDGESLSVCLTIYDRSIEVAYHNSGVLQPEARALLDGINSHLPSEYQLKWYSWADIKKKRRKKAEP